MGRRALPFSVLSPTVKIMIDIKFTLEGKVEMARRMRGIGKDVKDFRPEFKKSTDFMKGFFGNQVFTTRGRAIGEPWKPRRKAYPWPILQRTGRMRRGFRAKAEKLEGSVWNVASYFKYHQSRMPRRKLPRRIMLKLSNQIKDRIVQFFHAGVVKRVNKKR